MGQDIFNTDGSSTGNIVQGRAIIKTPGVGNDSQGIQVGQNEGVDNIGQDIAGVTGLYEQRWDDPTYYG